MADIPFPTLPPLGEYPTAGTDTEKQQWTWLANLQLRVIESQQKQQCHADMLAFKDQIVSLASDVLAPHWERGDEAREQIAASLKLLASAVAGVSGKPLPEPTPLPWPVPF